ncbi:hypothetical protein ACHAW5_009118 [Stephanodiscus triporus]|uniref:Uncharacterized protein n=1 Tax=Stephanodiscus triporus TaxID=2934178 RepID=A0ABD3P7U1_9STRA
MGILPVETSKKPLIFARMKPVLVFSRGDTCWQHLQGSAFRNRSNLCLLSILFMWCMTSRIHA